MTATTPEQPKPTMPPVDDADNLDVANAMLKRFRKQLAPLPAEWRAWVLSSLEVTKFEDAQ